MYMCCISIMKMFFMDCYSGMYTWAKVLLFAVVVVSIFCFSLIGIVEFFIVDIGVLLLEAMQKDGDISACIKYMLDID